MAAKMAAMVSLYKKTAPGIPRTVLIEPASGEKTGGGGLEPGELRFIAVHTDPHRTAEIDAEHGHQAFGADVLVIGADDNIKGLLGGQCHKCLDIFKRTHPNIELLHQNPSDTVQIKNYRI